jgi:glycerophosphoryl diester phosphodiesterase
LKVFAHRGSSVLWPENTMLAFDRAADFGVSGFETDLRLSADNEIILAHDENLARFGLPQHNISALTAPEIGALKIFSIDGQHSDHCLTLDRLLRKYPDKDYIFDCKISDRNLLLLLKDLLTELGFHNRIWFLTWSREMDDHVMNVFSGYRLFPREPVIKRWGIACLIGLGRYFEPKQELLALPPYFMSIPLIRPAYVRSMKSRHKLFLGYLVNREKDFRRCLAGGVDYILTDRPDRLPVVSQQPDVT